jgi:Protein of unknown function (DUF3105)
MRRPIASVTDPQRERTVANKTKQQEKNRRAKVEAMRREQEARERRKSLLIIVTAVVIGLGLVAAAVLPGYLDKRNDPANKALSSFGVDAAAAQCSDVTTDTVPAPPNNMPNWHIEEGTKAEYDVTPPSYGLHWPAPAFPASAFYTAEDRPQMEQLVHNLEHGYTILWYDDTIKGDQLETLRDLSASAREQDAVGDGKKFIVSAWDDSYGDFPQGKHVALSHWSAKDDQRGGTIDSGHRQLCGKISGEVVQKFIDTHPASDSPEPNAA